MPPSIRLPRVTDAPAMGEVMVETWLAAHQGQIPEGQWQRRREEWTPEVSARSWQRTLEEEEADPNVEECIYVAVNDEDRVVGIAMATPSRFDFLENAAEVGLLYVTPAYQGQGLGRKLVEAVAAHHARLGRRALMISVLETNAPARAFYEAIGGRLVGAHETEDYGYREPQVVYGWEDIRVVIGSGG